MSRRRRKRGSEPAGQLGVELAEPVDAHHYDQRALIAVAHQPQLVIEADRARATPLEAAESSSQARSSDTPARCVNQGVRAAVT